MCPIVLYFTKQSRHIATELHSLAAQKHSISYVRFNNKYCTKLSIQRT